MTLVELLVAMAILAILAGLGARALSSLSENQQRLEVARRQWEAIAALFARIEDDVGHAVDWGTGDAQGMAAALWQVAPDNDALALVRIDGRQDRRMRVSFGRQQATVSMAMAPLPAVTAATDWQPVLDGVRRLVWRQMDADGNWHDDWPWPTRLPLAVSVTLEMEDGTRLQRVFALPQAA
jgi:general secretion pathway protein J